DHDVVAGQDRRHEVIGLVQVVGDGAVFVEAAVEVVRSHTERLLFQRAVGDGQHVLVMQRAMVSYRLAYSNDDTLRNHHFAAGPAAEMVVKQARQLRIDNPIACRSKASRARKPRLRSNSNSPATLSKRHCRSSLEKDGNGVNGALDRKSTRLN